MRNRSGVAGWLVGLVLVTALGRAEVAAQGDIPEAGASRRAGSDRPVFRVGVGLGVGTVGSAQGGAALRGGVSLSPRPDRSFSVRASWVEELALFTSPAESAWDVGILYGAQKRSRRGYLSASAGLALVGGMRRGALIPPAEECWDLWCALGQAFDQRYEEEPFRTVGIPFDVEAGWTFSDSFGLALTGFGNLNSTRSFVGYSLTFLVGRVR